MRTSLGYGTNSARKIKRGYLSAFLTGFFFPVTVFFYMMAYVINEALVHWNRRPKNKAKWGRDSVISIEMLATLIVIPTVGLVASVGTSWAFYQFAESSSKPGLINDAWVTLTVTMIVSLLIIVSTVRELARHQEGIEVFPFERDAKPSVALRQLRDLRVRVDAAFLPGRYREASRWIDEICADDARIESFSRRAALHRLLRKGSLDFRQYVVMMSGGLMSTAAVLLFIWIKFQPPGGTLAQWQLTLALPIMFVLFIALFRGTVACRLLLEAFRHQRLEKRIRIMESRQQERTEGGASSAIQLQSLNDKLVALTTEIEQLRSDIRRSQVQATPRFKIWGTR
ncbi:sterol desaturase/sphingolipid hydroxylase (fatty acid hydroxylase superfamily) [Pseudarthrobacter sp. W1I19]|uniref:hypothetical protein n=1 Tax=Pseudarthrobacter sp. W1I19 TaxID=3042288 RepID=UPI0027825A4C|nr:hypothetical protein [Pseudarthrobacter sp. W1I19]MDQ0924566.1 sterol desaturase/sphingolipid hydroxylase (fatty acid hydroxylase superfamily) [Pseudarthrobacter sp. W1I19]